MANYKMILTGFEWDDTLGAISEKPVRIETNMPYSDDTGATHYGMPVTDQAYYGMIRNFLKSCERGDSQFDDIEAVDFSKASLFRILSQEGCEFIRFNFCIIDRSRNLMSLVMEGLDRYGKPLNEEQAYSMMSGYSTRGATTTSAKEEKGNGTGTTSTLRGFMSLRQQYQKYKEDMATNYEDDQTFRSGSTSAKSNEDSAGSDLDMNIAEFARNYMYPEK